jgi:hypothetical protein
VSYANSSIHQAFRGHRHVSTRSRGGDREILWVALRGECPRCSTWPAPQEGGSKILRVEIVMCAHPSWYPAGVTMGLHFGASKNNRLVCVLLLAPRGGDRKASHVGSEESSCMRVLVGSSER